ncbi:uncharacterized protein DAT39_020441, partial [Clarias magur]
KNMNDIVSGVQQYQTSLLDNLRKQMEAVLKKHLGSTSSPLEKEAKNIFDNFIDPFASVATTFRQDSLINKQFSCLEAEEVSIGQTICKKKCGNLFLKDK